MKILFILVYLILSLEANDFSDINTHVKPLTHQELIKYIPLVKTEKKISNNIKYKISIKKQFAQELDLKSVSRTKKETIKTDKESTEFFNTLNDNDSKPINME